MAYKRVSLRSESPFVFVGLSEYPKVNVGILSTKKDDDHDNPYKWAREKFGISEIVKKRRSLLNSSIQTIANTRNERLVSLSQEIAMAQTAAECEIDVSPTNLGLLTNQKEAIPFGPRAQLYNATALSNIKVDKRIENAVGDVDAKANSTVTELFAKGIREHKISQLLSVGNLGVAKNRKLVPTRWSITATDDMVGKQLLKKLPEFDTAPSHVVAADYLGNYFLILLFDHQWMFEFVEVFNNGNTIKSDCELTYGRSNYVNETAGAYYAVRLAVLEYLTKIQKQAGVVVIRFITSDYHTPLGVWVVRETIRKALEEKPLHFDDKKLVSSYARAWCKKKFQYDYSRVLEKSIVLQEILSQKSLSEFFG